MEIKKLGIQTGYRLPLKISDEQLGRISAAAPEAELFLGKRTEDILAQTSDLDALICMPDAVDGTCGEHLSKLPSLKWCQSWVSGVDTLMKSSLARKEGMRISAVRQIQAAPLSDHVVALIYYYMRNLEALIQSRPEKDWKRGVMAPRFEAEGSTVGLVGLGYIGTEIAKKLHALGFRVLATKRSPVESPYVEICYPLSKLDEMLPQCDYVVLILPLNAESEGLFGKHEFQLMKKSAYLINVARGAIVKDQDLFEALDSGEIAGAALDAFHHEPLPVDDPIWTHPKIFMSYHIAAVSASIIDRSVDRVAENIRHYIANEPLLFEDTIPL